MPIKSRHEKKRPPVCIFSKEVFVITKLKALKLIEDGLTQAEVTERLGIHDHKRVQNWLWDYRREGIPD